MSISIKDLTGFDFSDKYLNIHETFTIEKDGKQVDFKIVKEGHDDIDEYSIEYKYYTNNRLMKRNVSYKNPFTIYREVEKDILKLEDKLNRHAILIKNTLEDFNPDFDNWMELTESLSSEIDLLKLFPNYKSSKIPQDLSKEGLAKYLDKFSKYELEKLFSDLSILDFEVISQNIWGEDYEYLIRKAFSVHLFGEEFFDFQIYREINNKRQNEYINCILNRYGFDIDKYDLIGPVINSIINDSYDSHLVRSINRLKLEKRIKEENINLNDFSEENRRKISKLQHEIYDYNKSENIYKQTNFKNLEEDPLTKSKYIYVLKAISSYSKSQTVMRYKTPNENRDNDSVQTIALNNGHIKTGNSKDSLSVYSVNQLKNTLKKYGLSVSGNKIHLINRIKDNLSDEIVNNEFPKRYFSLTEKGQEYLDKYYYLAEFYSVIPPNFTIDEFDLICKSNPDINPDDIIKCLVNEKWLIWDETLGSEPKIEDYENNELKLGIILGNRGRDDNYYRNLYDSLILV